MFLKLIVFVGYNNNNGYSGGYGRSHGSDTEDTPPKHQGGNPYPSPQPNYPPSGQHPSSPPSPSYQRDPPQSYSSYNPAPQPYSPPSPPSGYQPYNN